MRKIGAISIFNSHNHQSTALAPTSLIRKKEWKMWVVICANLLCQHYVAMLFVDLYNKLPTWLLVTRCLYTMN